MLGLSFDVKFTVQYMREKFIDIQARSLSEKCGQYPKLRTFILFKDFMNDAVYTKKPLTYFNRRLMARLRLGCLPLHLETGRYGPHRIPEEQRICEGCKKLTGEQLVECESHFLFHCKVYQAEREKWFNALTMPSNFQILSIAQKFQLVLNQPSNIRPTAIFIANAMNLRSQFLNIK